MAWIDVLSSLWSDYTLRTIMLGMSVLGVVSGVLGAFAVLRRQSLLGDAISHAALPGVVIAFLLTRSKAPVVLVLGASLAGWLATLWMTRIVRNTRLKEDSALGLVLSVFFGFGLMLLTFTQRLADARQAGLDRFLFGQAAALLMVDVWTMAAIGGLALLVVGLLWKEFKLLAFDREFGASLGLPMGALDILMVTLLVAAIVIGLQSVGVVLMSAMVVAPAAAARQWTDRLGLMVGLSALFGALSGIAGALWSSMGQGISTGPAVVLCASVIVVISLLLAPNRGMLWNGLRAWRNRRTLQQEALLSDLYTLAMQHADLGHPHAMGVLQAMRPWQGGLRHNLRLLETQGYVHRAGPNEWSLTAQGARAAQALGLADSGRAAAYPLPEAGSLRQ